MTRKILAAMAAALLSTAAVSAAAPTRIPGRMLVGYQAGATEGQRASARAAVRAAGHARLSRGIDLYEVPGADLDALMLSVERMPGVAWAEPDYLIPPEWIPNDPYFANQYHLPLIEAPAAWDTATGAGVVVAVLDSGLNANQPEFAGKVVPGWNFWDNNADTTDVFGHGTGVAGVIGAVTDNAYQVASVAPGCLLMPVRISDTTGSTASAVMVAALDWLAQQNVEVANCSYNVSLITAIQAQAKVYFESGGTLTISSGNMGTVYTFPDQPYSLCVSATDSTDNLCSFSNTGPHVDFSAPGQGVVTASWVDRVGSATGTSFSAPIVAGVAALCVSANPSLGPAEIREAMRIGAEDLGDPGRDTLYGWGRVNARRAVEAAIALPPPPADTQPPVPDVDPLPVYAAYVPFTLPAPTATDAVDGTVTGTTMDATSFASAGTFTVAWTYTDRAGNSASQTQTVVAMDVDRTPPAVTVTSAGFATKGGKLVATATATDNTGVTKVEFLLDGKVVATDTEAPYACSTPVKRLAKGAHTVQAAAYDAVGNRGLSSPVTVVK